MLETLIAYHCGPALAGIKPANLVACYRANNPNLYEEICWLNLQLNRKDIYLEILCTCDRRILLLVYRSRVLQQYLQQEEVQALLRAYGYEDSWDLSRRFQHLKRRLQEHEFPHEIGAFLGYPIADIYGFIHHKDEGCLLTGEWKVYHNPESAEKTFLRYKACRRALVRRISAGQTLAQVFCAASK